MASILHKRLTEATLRLLLAIFIMIQISIAHACGGLDEKLCNIFRDGRIGCNAGLADVLGKCQTPGMCGGEGQRLCFLLIDSRGGCNPELVDVSGTCTRPNCGGLDQHACAIIGRNSCDSGLVEVNDTCFTRGNCGGENQRACLIGERIGNSCDPNLVERNGKCIRTDCGALGKRACAVVGRNSCDDGLVEVNDTCFTRGDCGGADQRACLIGERVGNSCDQNLFEHAGMCYECGALGQRACAIVGRNSCDGGLVEVNDTCFTRGDCGGVDQRACLIGERNGNSCNPNLVERSGICIKNAVVVLPPAPKYFVFVRTDPPAPVLRPSEPVKILATAYDGKTKLPIRVDKIEIFQGNYFGPNSRAPKLIKTCIGVETENCQVSSLSGIAARTAKSVSLMAKMTNSDGVFASPIRITDIQLDVTPIRMNVSAEIVGAGKIAELPHNRAIDMVLFAGTGYDINTPSGAAVFSGRLKDELETMLGVSSLLRQPSSIADNLAAVNFYVALAPATVKHIGLFGMCEHSTAGPVPFGDAQGILHPNLKCRDWSVPGPFYSAGTPRISWHEMHHAAFGLSDEYCEGTVHHQNARFSNVYNNQSECERLSANASTCKRIATPTGCVDPNCLCSTSYWRSDEGTNDVMYFNGLEQADDLGAIKGKFDDCRAGRC